MCRPRSKGTGRAGVARSGVLLSCAGRAAQQECALRKGVSRPSLARRLSTFFSLTARVGRTSRAAVSADLRLAACCAAALHLPHQPMDGASTPPLGGEAQNPHPKPACGGPAAAPATPAPAASTPARGPPDEGEAGVTVSTRARKAVSFDVDRAAAGAAAAPAALEAAVAALGIDDAGSDEEEEDEGAVDAAQLEAAFRGDGE